MLLLAHQLGMTVGDGEEPEVSSVDPIGERHGVYRPAAMDMSMPNGVMMVLRWA